MLRKQRMPDLTSPKMLRDTIPLNTLQDVLAFHLTQVERFRRLAATRNPKGFTSERNRLKADLSQLRFHQRIVDVLERSVREHDAAYQEFKQR